MTLTDRRAVLLAALAYLLLTLAYTWPLPINLVHGVAHDYGDPILNAWILWWTTQAVPLTTAWWNAPIFYPATGTFAFSEHLLGQTPVAAPLIALSGHALLGYNVMLIATYVLSGLGAYFLGFTLTKRHDAAFVAGLAFAFAPYRLAQVPHIQVLSAYWSPVCLAALHRYDRDPRASWGALAAGAWLMQALSNGYYLFFLSILLACWFVWFALGRWPLRQIARVAICFAAAAALLIPVLLGYARVLADTYGFSREAGEIGHFGADVAGLLHASDELWLWGWIHVVRTPEGGLFPGPAIAALALFAMFAARPFATDTESGRASRWLRGIVGSAFVLFVIAGLMPALRGGWRLTIGGVRILSIGRADVPMMIAFLMLIGWIALLPRARNGIRNRSALLYYGLAAFAMFVFALGPDPELLGKRMLLHAPYAWLMRLPGLDGLRVPARFWMMALVCLSAIAALAVNRLHGRTRRIAASIAAAGLVLDGWPRSFTVLPAPEHRPGPADVVARLDLPMSDDRGALALYQQTLDRVPLYGGFTGYSAPHQYPMRQMLESHDLRILRALAAYGPLGIVIDHADDADGMYREFVMAYPGVAVHERHGRWSSYRLPRNESGDLIPDQSGEPIRIKALVGVPSGPHTPSAIDGDLETRWSAGIQGRAAADFTIELDEPSHVGQLVTDLGRYYRDFPVKLRIDVSLDGTTWETVYAGDGALQTYYAALRHPKQVPVVYAIERDNVRFIRMTQLGFGTHDWSIPEVRVLK